MELALDASAALAEGPRWDARIARLLWVDIYGCALHRFDPATRRGRGHAAARQGRLRRADRRTPTACSSRSPTGSRSSTSAHGELEPLVDLPHAHPGLRTNDGAVDPAGRFWIGTMADDERRTRARCTASTAAT